MPQRILHVILAAASLLSPRGADSLVVTRSASGPLPRQSSAPCLAPSDSDFVVPLDLTSRTWFVQGKNSGIYSLALAVADKTQGDCRRPIASLTGTDGEYFEYGCIDAARPKEVIVGSMKGSKGRPSRSWRIDYRRRRFVPVPPTRVMCRNEGYENDKDTPGWDLRSAAAMRIASHTFRN